LRRRIHTTHTQGNRSKLRFSAVSVCGKTLYGEGVFAIHKHVASICCVSSYTGGLGVLTDRSGRVRWSTGGATKAEESRIEWFNKVADFQSREGREGRWDSEEKTDWETVLHAGACGTGGSELPMNGAGRRWRHSHANDTFVYYFEPAVNAIFWASWRFLGGDGGMMNDEEQMSKA
jgi:hypothetical protein